VLAVKAPIRADIPIADGKDPLKPGSVARLKADDVFAYEFASD